MKSTWARRGGRQPRQLGGGLRGITARFSIAILILLIFTVIVFSRIRRPSPSIQDTDVNKLWRTAPAAGWRPSSAPRSYWPSPSTKTTGYLRVRCNGGLNQQRSAICNAVLAARIMNATLVLPELDTNSFWHDEGGFPGVYDVEHFVYTLRYDVHIVEKIPEITTHGKVKKLKAVQIRPPRDAPLN